MNEYQVSQVRVTASIKWSIASQICEYIVLNINIFNAEYHAIIEIVECESVAQKMAELLHNYVIIT